MQIFLPRIKTGLAKYNLERFYQFNVLFKQDVQRVTSKGTKPDWCCCGTWSICRAALSAWRTTRRSAGAHTAQAHVGRHVANLHTSLPADSRQLTVADHWRCVHRRQSRHCLTTVRHWTHLACQRNGSPLGEIVCVCIRPCRSVTHKPLYIHLYSSKKR